MSRLQLIGYLSSVLILTSFNPNPQRSLDSNDIIVSGEITGVGSYPTYDSAIEGVFVKLTILNTSVSEKRFLTMSCSWSDNWQTDNQNLLLYYPGCDKNVPTEIILKPHKSAIFYGFFNTYN